MSVPTSYSEVELVEFVERELGALSGVLAWQSHDYMRVVYSTLRAYGVSDIDDADDAEKIEALARVALWSAAVRSLASFYSFSDPGGSSQQSDLQKQALVALRDARRDAHAHMPSYSVSTTRILRSDDPYHVDADEDGGFA